MTRRRRPHTSGGGDALDLFSPNASAPARAAARESLPFPFGVAERGARVEPERPSHEAPESSDGFVIDPYARVSEPATEWSGDARIPGATPATAVDVSALTHTLKEIVEGAFVPLWVRGEVTDFKAHRNGHWYFCLRDDAAQIRCVVWARDARRLPAPPDDGMQVVALGQASVYAARAELQLVVRALDAHGDGLWRKALERTRAALDADGLLDPARKRPLPRYPRRVAVVTSPDGAALHDILAVVRRRCPVVEIVVVPARVQGDGAAGELRAAVERVGRWRMADVLIVGRGGGGREDLWAFNDELLARAIAECPVPTVSAVGHETDVSICDLVADVRAATPSVAAETVVPVLVDLHADARSLGVALREAMERRLVSARGECSEGASDLAAAAARMVERGRARVETAAAGLHALSPLATLARGYAVARDGQGNTLSRSAHFAPGAEYDLLLTDGHVRSRVLGAEERT